MVINTPFEKDEFPSMTKALYTGCSLNEIRDMYIEDLRKTKNLCNILYANKLEEAKDMLSIEKLHELESDFHALKEHLRKWCKNKKISITLKRRKKDFIGLNEKIRLFIHDKKPLSNILDILGFRIILCTGIKDDETSIQLCYEALYEVITFLLIEKHCILQKAEPTLNTGFSPEKESNIFLPKKSLLHPDFRDNVKDYIINPKSNGYQSLHFVVQKPNGVIFEIQIRTYAMDILAEHGSGSHKNYKNKRYLNSSISPKIDYAKIHIPGFYLLENGEIYDCVGLRYSVDPFNLL